MEEQRRKRHELEAHALGLAPRNESSDVVPAAEPPSVRKLIDRYLDQIKTLKKPNTHRKYDAVLTRFAKVFCNGSRFSPATRAKIAIRYSEGPPIWYRIDPVFPRQLTGRGPERLRNPRSSGTFAPPALQPSVYLSHRQRKLGRGSTLHRPLDPDGHSPTLSTQSRSRHACLPKTHDPCHWQRGLSYTRGAAVG